MPDTKISGLTADAAPTGDDLLVLVNDPAGAPGNRKATLTDFFTSAPAVAGFLSHVDTDNTLASNSDTLVPSQKAIKAYVDTIGSATVVHKTDTDVSTWSFTINETTMASDLATKFPTQHSVKAYVDATFTGTVHTSDTDAHTWSFISNDTTLAGNSANKLATEHAVKGYVDSLPTLTTSDTVKVPIATSSGVTTLDVSGLLSSSTTTFTDSTFRVQNVTDTTKLLAFDVSAVPTSTTRTLSLPVTSVDDTLVLTAATQTVTNKSFTTPTLTGAPVMTGTFSLSTPSGSITSAPNPLLYTGVTFNINYASGAAPTPLAHGALINWVQSAGASAHSAVKVTSTVKNDPSSAANLSAAGNGAAGRWFSDESTIEADSQSITAGAWVALGARATFSTIGTGSPAITNGSYNGITYSPTVNTGVTLTSMTGCSVGGTINSGGTVTTFSGVKVNAPTVGGTVTTMYGVDIAALTGSTNVGIRNADTSRLVGRTTHGADAAATWLVHLQGGNSATAAYGMDTSTTGPANHGTSNGGGTISVYKGATNYYLLISFNNGGTQQYKYLQVNDNTSVTWQTATSLPT